MSELHYCICQKYSKAYVRTITYYFSSQKGHNKKIENWKGSYSALIQVSCIKFIKIFPRKFKYCVPQKILMDRQWLLQGTCHMVRPEQLELKSNTLITVVPDLITASQSTWLFHMVDSWQRSELEWIWLV